MKRDFTDLLIHGAVALAIVLLTATLWGI